MSTLHKIVKDEEKEWPSEEQDAFLESLFHTYYKMLCRFSFRLFMIKIKRKMWFRPVLSTYGKKEIVSPFNLLLNRIYTVLFIIEVSTNTPGRKILSTKTSLF